MIYTVTLNPALDYVVKLETLKTGEINLCSGATVYCGGKGNNVSWVLKELGFDSVALGFSAGFAGAAIEEILRQKGIDSDYVRLKNGLNRINIKIRAGQETDINVTGPKVEKEEIEQLSGKLNRLKNGDTLVLAGSVPPSLPDDIYEKILQTLAGRKIRTVVDAAGQSLLKTLKYKPYLIKPNHHELGELFGVTIADKEQAQNYALKLQQMGARNVMVSFAEQGAVFAAESGEVYHTKAAKGKLINSVGAGDSTVAGFLAAIEWKWNPQKAFEFGVCAGCATAFCEGLASREEILKIAEDKDFV